MTVAPASRRAPVAYGNGFNDAVPCRGRVFTHMQKNCRRATVHIPAARCLVILKHAACSETGALRYCVCSLAGSGSFPASVPFGRAERETIKLREVL